MEDAAKEGNAVNDAQLDSESYLVGDSQLVNYSYVPITFEYVPHTFVYLTYLVINNIAECKF